MHVKVKHNISLTFEKIQQLRMKKKKKRSKGENQRENPRGFSCNYFLFFFFNEMTFVRVYAGYPVRSSQIQWIGFLRDESFFFVVRDSWRRILDACLESSYFIDPDFTKKNMTRTFFFIWYFINFLKRKRTWKNNFYEYAMNIIILIW